MNPADSLVIFWLTATPEAVLHSVFRPPHFPDLPAKDARRWTKWWVPIGVTGWRLSGETAWRPMTTLPREFGLIPAERIGKVYVDEDEE